MSDKFDATAFVDCASCVYCHNRTCQECWQCSNRLLLLAKIEEMKEKEPEVAKFLTYWRDTEMRRIEDEKRYFAFLSSHQVSEKADAEIVKHLRAMADKIEEEGPHFPIYARLPELPIFGKGEYFATIEVEMVKHPLGG